MQENTENKTHNTPYYVRFEVLNSYVTVKSSGMQSSVPECGAHYISNDYLTLKKEI